MALHEKSLTLHERSLTLHEKTLVLHETSLVLYEKSLALQKMTWPSRTVCKRLTSQNSNFKDELNAFSYRLRTVEITCTSMVLVEKQSHHTYHTKTTKQSASHTTCFCGSSTHTACFLGSYLYRWKCSIWKRANLLHHVWHIHCQSLHLLPSALGTGPKNICWVPKDGRYRPCATLRA